MSRDSLSAPGATHLAKPAPSSVKRIDEWSVAQMGDRLVQRMQSSVLASRSDRLMSPALAYGRHRGPLRSASRLAAVAVTLYHREGQWWIPTTLRPRSLKHHGGQICLPGGRVEPGENVYDAARREFYEELGVPCDVGRVCGELSTQYVYASDNRVHPIVLIVQPPVPAWNPDPREVDEVIEIPLTTLLNPRSKTTLIREKPVLRDGHVCDVLSYRAPSFRTDSAVCTRWNQHGSATDSADIRPLASRMIWGATAMILDELAQLLR